MTSSTHIFYACDEIEKCFITSIWRLQDNTGHERVETILPKGTVEIIFNLSERVIYVNPDTNTRATLPTCFINGINFRPFHLIKNGQQLFVGIQLNVIGLKALLEIPVKEFNDTIVESSIVCKSLAELHHQLFSTNTFEEQVRIIRRWMHQRISISKYGYKVNKIHTLFYSHNLNNPTIKEFSIKKCISDRQLRRLSSEWLGMNTEEFLSYNKYLSALHSLHYSDLSLGQIALEAGYYDQSHFIREFKSYTRITPKEYRLSVKGIPGHIFD